MDPLVASIAPAPGRASRSVGCSGTGRRERSRRLGLGWISTAILGAAAVLLASPMAAAALPDGRALELVTPVEMNGASPSSVVPAPSGEAVDFQAAPFGDATASGNTLYQARRTAGGWQTTALTPANVVQPKPFAHTGPVFVTPDLGQSIFTTEQPLSSGSEDGGALNLFEESSHGALALVSQGSEVGTGLDSATFDGATPNGDFVAFDSAEPLVQAAAGLEESGFQTDDYLYLRDIPAASTELVDVDDKGVLLDAEGAVLGNGNDLISGEPSAPGEASPFTELPADGFGGTTTHAISADGSKVFFESPSPAPDEVEMTYYSNHVVHLYMHKEGASTVQLDREGTVGPEEEHQKKVAGARYMGASEDGSEVFFLSDEGLAGDEFKDAELYVYDTEDEKLTPVSVAPEGAGAVDGAVYGVTAIANDGSRVYYVAKGKLAANENAVGLSAAEGKPNLYVYDTLTGKNTFVAQLGLEEVEMGEPGSGHPGRLTSYLDVERLAVPTPNGEVLVFVSSGDLTGEDHNGTAQVYRYDATLEKLTCISCGPTATGSASLGINVGSQEGAIGGGSYDPPGQSAPMSATGERIFFETESALAAEDENTGSPPLELGLGESTEEIPSDVDVYEWENGHVYLLSAGKPGLTRLQGVTPSGNNVFFTSSASIAGGAPVGYVSLYDARVGGGFAAPPRSGEEDTSCDSISACQGALAEFPKFGVPGTSTLSDTNAVPTATKPVQQGKTSKKQGKQKQRKKHGRKRKGRRAAAGKSHGPTKRAAAASKHDRRVAR